MQTTQTAKSSQLKAGMAVVVAVAETIRELGQAPAGPIYAALMAKGIDYQAFEKVGPFHTRMSPRRSTTPLPVRIERIFLSRPERLARARPDAGLAPVKETTMYFTIDTDLNVTAHAKPADSSEKNASGERVYQGSAA